MHSVECRVANAEMSVWPQSAGGVKDNFGAISGGAEPDLGVTFDHPMCNYGFFAIVQVMAFIFVIVDDPACCPFRGVYTTLLVIRRAGDGCKATGTAVT